MLTITYIITVYNKEQYLPKVIAALKKITGDFAREFIFINDGSTDGSLALLEESTKDLPRSTIISQENKGPSLSTNAGIRLAKGDYVHFVDGDDIIEPNATTILLNNINAFNCDVAFSLKGSYDIENGQKQYFDRVPDVSFIEDPLGAMLCGKVSHIRKIGSSGSLVKLKTLKKAGGCDENVFIQDFSLSLRLSLLSQFVRINKSLYYSPMIYTKNNLSSNKQFEYYHTLLTAANFLQDNKEVYDGHARDFNKLLWSTVWRMDKNWSNWWGYLKSRVSFGQNSYDDLIKLYKIYLEKYKHVNRR